MSVPQKQNCKNKRRGCDYKNPDPFLLDKHENCLCNYDGCKCPVCGERYQGSRWIDHLALSDGLEHALVYGNCARIVLTYKNWEQFKRYTIKAHEKLFIFWFLFGRDVVSMSLVADVDDFGYKYFMCEYKVFVSGYDKCAQGNMLPDSNLKVFRMARDWRKDIFVPHAHIKKLYDGQSEKCTIELAIVKLQGN